MNLKCLPVYSDFYSLCICRKQCILSESRFDFLKDLVKSLPDVSGPDDEVPMSPETPPLQINAPNIVTACSTTMQHPDPLE